MDYLKTEMSIQDTIQILENIQKEAVTAILFLMNMQSRLNDYQEEEENAKRP